MDQTIVFDLDLIHRYDKAGPRYTSYPTAVQFHTGFGETQYRDWAERSNQQSRAADKPTPLSLYFHLPFCDTVCFYCGCNKVVTKDRSKARPYLDRLYQEMAMQAALFDNNRVVDQLHWGGGTPTFISAAEMQELMNVTRKYFRLHDDDTGEYSIEIDPREITLETLTLLRKLGFNRVSDRRLRKFDLRIGDHKRLVGQAVTGQGFLQLCDRADIARMNLGHRNDRLAREYANV